MCTPSPTAQTTEIGSHCGFAHVAHRPWIPEDLGNCQVVLLRELDGQGLMGHVQVRQACRQAHICVTWTGEVVVPVCPGPVSPKQKDITQTAQTSLPSPAVAGPLGLVNHASKKAPSSIHGMTMSSSVSGSMTKFSGLNLGRYHLRPHSNISTG